MTVRFFSVKPLETQIRPGQKILKANDYEQLVEYGQFTQILEDRLKQREQAMSVELEHAVKRSETQGLERANQQATIKMVEFTHAMQRYIQALEPQLVELVSIAVRKVIQGFDDEERVRQAVLSGLEVVRGGNKLIVRVNPQLQPMVSEYLESVPHRFSGIEVVGDTQLSTDDCIVESDIGVVNSGLKSQLAAVDYALRQVAYGQSAE